MTIRSQGCAIHNMYFECVRQIRHIRWIEHHLPTSTKYWSWGFSKISGIIATVGCCEQSSAKKWTLLTSSHVPAADISGYKQAFIEIYMVFLSCNLIPCIWDCNITREKLLNILRANNFILSCYLHSICSRLIIT